MADAALDRNGGGSHHEPVMVAEVLELLEPERGGLYFDGTLGGGGHAAALLEQGRSAELIGVDRDPSAVAAARERLAPWSERIRVVEGNYADVAERLEEPLSGALLDLGVSSWQIDEVERGFSFRAGVALDMRMEGEGGGSTAADLLNESSEAALRSIFREFGEERGAGRLARAVVEARRRSPFRTSDDLVSVMESVYAHRPSQQSRARIFQAVRIAVNRELESLERSLPALRDRLEPDGVLVVLSYHSLEDRRVKNAFREWSRTCVCPPRLPECRCRGRALGEVLTRRPLRPRAEEIESNVRARSARLRGWRKTP